MAINLNGWDMDEIQTEMRNKSFFEIQIIYKEKTMLIAEKGTEYVQAFKDKNEVAKERLEKEFEHLEKEKCVIALKIADELTKGKE